ncbi:hypothetical protein ACSBR2_024247 [Camellia fascicularis]
MEIERVIYVNKLGQARSIYLKHWAELRVEVKALDSSVLGYLGTKLDRDNVRGLTWLSKASERFPAHIFRLAHGLTRRLKATSKAIDEILETIIDKHEQDVNRNQKHQKDFIHVMLSLINKSSNAQDQLPYSVDRASIKPYCIGCGSKSN